MISSRWSLSFVPQKVAFGILSVLLPLYVIENIGGNVWDVGFILSMASFVRIPAVVLWARCIDNVARCKIFILVSFLIPSSMIFLFTIANNVWSFLGLNVVLSIFHVAHAPASRVLIAESYPRARWEGQLARHKFSLGLSAVIGLFTGGLWMGRLDNQSLMLLCGVLVFLSLILSAILVQDPSVMIERRIARFERFVHLAEQAYNLAYAPTNHIRARNKKMYLTRYPSPKYFILGIFLFPLATSMVLTIIPVFLYANIGASSSVVFYIVLTESITALIGYTLVKKYKQRQNLKLIEVASTLCILFPLLILASERMPLYLSLILTSSALAIAGFTWPYFSVPSTTLWMETAPSGSGGIYNAFVTLGIALGSLVGGFIPLHYGYETLFILSAAISGISLLFFVSSTRMELRP